MSFGIAFNDVIDRVQKSFYKANIVTDYVCCVNLENYQSCFESAIEQIRATIADPGFQFYIGITEDPIRRWDELGLGRSYDYMMLLYAAPTGKTTRPTTTKTTTETDGTKTAHTACSCYDGRKTN